MTVQPIERETNLPRSNHRVVELCILGINYNYSRFIAAHMANWNDARSAADQFLIVDDQSTLRDGAHTAVFTQFRDNWTTTQHVKSRSNAINQMRAISHGLSLTGIKDSTYYWVIDCDDIPVAGAVGAIKQELRANPSFDLFALRRYEEIGSGDVSTPRRSHPFWLTDAPTSSLIVKGSLLKQVLPKLFYERHFADVWYDIRLSALARPSRTKISSVISHVKTVHGANDSLRYKTNRLKIARRIFSSLVYRFTVAARL